MASKVPNRQARASLLGLEVLEERCMPAAIFGPIPPVPNPAEDFSARLWFDAKGRIPSFDAARLSAPAYESTGGIPIQDPAGGDARFVSANNRQQIGQIEEFLKSSFRVGKLVIDNGINESDLLLDELMLAGGPRATTFIDIPLSLKANPTDTIASEIIRSNKSAQFEDMDFQLTLDHPSPQQLVAFVLVPTQNGARVERLFRQPGESDFGGVSNGLQNIVLDADAATPPGVEITSGFRYRFTKSDNDQIDYSEGEATKLTLVIVDFVPSGAEARGLVRDFKVGIQFKRLEADKITANNATISGNLSQAFLPVGAGRHLAKAGLDQLAVTTKTFDFTPAETNLYQVNRARLNPFPFSLSPVIITDASGQPVSGEPVKGVIQQFILRKGETYRIQTTATPKPNSTLTANAEFIIDIRQKGKFLLNTGTNQWSESGKASVNESDAFRFTPAISGPYEIAVSSPLAQTSLVSSDGVSVSPLPGFWPARYALEAGKEYLLLARSSASSVNSGGFSIEAKLVHDQPNPILLGQTVPIEIKSPGHRPLVPFVMPRDGDVEISFRSDDPNLLDTFIVVRGVPGDGSPSPQIVPFIAGFDDNSAVFDPDHPARNRDSTVRLNLKGGASLLIECRGKRGFIGTGMLSVLPLASGALLPSQDNQDASKAPEITFVPLSEGSRGTIRGQIDFAGDSARPGNVDVFRFQAPKSGTFTLNIIPENDPARNNALAFEAVVLDERGERMCGNIFVAGPRPNFDQLDLVEGKFYYISVSANGEAPSANQTGKYRILLETAGSSAGNFNPTGPGRFLSQGPILQETTPFGTFFNRFGNGLISVNSTKLFSDASIAAKGLEFEVRRNGLVIARSKDGAVESLPVEADVAYDFFPNSRKGGASAQSEGATSKASFSLDLQFSLPPAPPAQPLATTTMEKQVSIALNDPAFLRVVLVVALGPSGEPLATLPEPELPPARPEAPGVPVGSARPDARPVISEQEILQGAALDIIATGAIDQLAIFARQGPPDSPALWRAVAWLADAISEWNAPQPTETGTPAIIPPAAASRLPSAGDDIAATGAPTAPRRTPESPSMEELEPTPPRNWTDAALAVMVSTALAACSWIPTRRDSKRTLGKIQTGKAASI